MKIFTQLYTKDWRIYARDATRACK